MGWSKASDLKFNAKGELIAKIGSNDTKAVRTDPSFAADFKFGPNGELLLAAEDNPGGTTDHSVLLNRDDPDQHPATAIAVADGESVQAKLDALQENMARLTLEVASLNRFERIDYNGGFWSIQCDTTIAAGKYYKFDEVTIEPEGRLVCNGILFTHRFTNNGVLVENGHVIIIP